jgi:putative ABC transport system substrate-binding protein
MDRRAFVGTIAVSVITAHSVSRGQPRPTIRRVGMLLLPSESGTAHLRDAFTQGMRNLGWVEGKNVEYRFVYADGAVERLDTKASELVGQNVEVIVAVSPAATRAAQRATKNDADCHGSRLERRR